MLIFFIEQRGEGDEEVNGHKPCKISPGLASTGEGMCSFLLPCSHSQVGRVGVFPCELNKDTLV